MRRVILLNGDAREERGTSEYDVTPGMLVELTAEGVYQPHSTAGGVAAPIFVRAAHEDNGAEIDDDIKAGSDFTVLKPNLGSAKINALTSDTIDAGEFVESAGDGTVRPFDSGAIVGLAVADSILPATGNGRVAIVPLFTGA